MDNSVNDYYAYCDNNIIDWKQEAEAVIRDVAQHVRHISVSTDLPPTRTESFINITTLDGKQMCVKLNAEGLQIVGDMHDTKDEECSSNHRYETPYALLSVVSSYVNSFGNSLVSALSKLEQKTAQEERLSDIE
ncbi:GSK3-beta interaction protein-like [Anopheles stephensi]|uniref:GSK3-beta interaction protein-like n=1 Tax=Anopheles stephensi TaxID=30069 RepID=UPI001658AA13|nr:GSK3-beta interaction protein-like [Anopheles stephensi]XP_035912664.1 GSK3-beta interaction protein-like [Anopheles stephensi]XP_035912665.1 GSK3-beta interaction protein-like [Anopheles stephensi]